jgi:hypothetical protein
LAAESDIIRGIQSNQLVGGFSMKKAVIVVGSHHAGKSRTISKFFKPLIGISRNSRCFRLGRRRGEVFSQSLEERFRYGQVLSQSLEEKGLRDVRQIVAKYRHYDMLVFAARPADERRSLHIALKRELNRCGFEVATVKVVADQDDSYYASKAKKIYRSLLTQALTVTK